jgi:hypothetical protein
MSDSTNGAGYNAWGSCNTSHYSAPPSWSSGDRQYDFNTHGRSDIVVCGHCGGSGSDSCGNTCGSCSGQGSYTH